MKVDMIGKRFGRLTVIAEGEKHHRKCTWVCQCDCGNITAPIDGHNLRRGATKSCGCLKLEKLIERSTSHGKSHSWIYRVYAGMKNRCYNPQDKHFCRWGGRGITVCDEWKNSFQAFYDYVSQLPHFGEKGYSLDRINNDGNYEPGNVRWATNETQCNNRSNQIFLEINGVTKTIAQWAKESGVPYRTIHQRHIMGVTGDALIIKKTERIDSYKTWC
jgi:hypothetical protein